MIANDPAEGVGANVHHDPAATGSLYYQLGFADGSSVVAPAASWLKVHVGTSTNPPRSLQMQTIAEHIQQGTFVRLAVAPAPALEHDPLLPLPAYVVGALTGDGHLRPSSVEFCNGDPEMHRLLATELPAGARLGTVVHGQHGVRVSVVGTGRTNPVLQGLRQLGLSGTHAWTKYVPEAYLEASAGDRLAYLQGIMDTDGSADRYGRVEYSSASPQLAHDVGELIRSLGGRATFSVRRNVHFTSPTQAERKQARDAYRLTGIRLPGLPLFRLTRKVVRQDESRDLRAWTIKTAEVVDLPAASPSTASGGSEDAATRRTA